MTMTNTPVFAQIPRSGAVSISAAVGALATDTPSNTMKILQAGANGAIVTRLWAVPRATTSAVSLLLFLSKASDSYATQKLIDSELMPSFAISTTAVIPETQFANYSETKPLRLEAGDQLWVGMQATGNSVFRAEWTDF